MIRTCILFFTLLATHVAWAQKTPDVLKTEFTAEALQQPLLLPDGKQTTAGEVLGTYKGQTVMLYIWAAWCPDCLRGFPELKAFQAANPEVPVVYFSRDRTEKQWKDAIGKFDLQGDHYWFGSDAKNGFTAAIDLNWIPRYMIIDPNGGIAHYYAIHADDPALQQAVDKLKQ
ncbi:TlpA family protein disulfide reductase [Parapedobacter soli]|uniref:TlpA family protein disulfide reductase n=1 Tax=Parapedobacter soli TaxID=416955 RepID=UPI0021C63450|nr:thioredoxin family protein [Parapedobacter soli]